jgi:hypothetical protein
VPRTTASAVEGILGRDYDGTTDLDPFIDTAEVMVDEAEAQAALSEPVVTMTDGRLELMERWLAAHFYQMSDPGYASKRTGAKSGVFTGKTDMGLAATRYGQTAMILDISGQLTSQSGAAGGGGSGGGKKVAGALWLGTEDEEVA